MTLQNLAERLFRDEQGQDVVEYALLATFVSLVGVAGAGLLGDALNNWYSQVSTNMNGAAMSAS
jgi:Flp pilus assembly pilin Flp